MPAAAPGRSNMKTKPDASKIKDLPGIEIIELEENELFAICPYCDPPRKIYRDKLGIHQAMAHGRPIREVFEEEDERRVNKRNEFFDNE